MHYVLNELWKRTYTELVPSRLLKDVQLSSSASGQTSMLLDRTLDNTEAVFWRAC